LRWSPPPKPTAARGWEGVRWRDRTRTSPVPVDIDALSAPAFFVAQSRTLDFLPTLPTNARMWAAGPETWRMLARRGLWVEGCAERLGFDTLRPTLESSVLGLPPLSDWRVFTHADAVETWRGSGLKAIATYRILPDEPDAALAKEMASATHFYWTSATQYRAARRTLPEYAQHACGPGKTLQQLRAAGVSNVTAFPSAEEWRAWLS
jgi:hypothetical protein